MLEDVKLIVADGGNVNARGPFGETLLHVAACNGYVEVCVFLYLIFSANCE